MKYVRCYIKAISSVVLSSQGDVVLPLPSIEVLAEVAGSQARTSIVVHVLESFVVTWMKLIKVTVGWIM